MPPLALPVLGLWYHWNPSIFGVFFCSRLSNYCNDVVFSVITVFRLFVLLYIPLQFVYIRFSVWFWVLLFLLFCFRVFVFLGYQIFRAFGLITENHPLPMKKKIGYKM